MLFFRVSTQSKRSGCRRQICLEEKKKDLIVRAVHKSLAPLVNTVVLVK